ncbi:hypothetical protein AJ79_08643 [Helicocarpus griseus UAMH5409]|uniref:Uncharacterized protein n=1 Tax=Helicocarpus griseus UAMH5409 TaxID=1447875 RepID=A0A2B7WIK8_9EURO|nr:hypothetical protein AJ79_08643 [Helicocarpus griseus UAMH5409]
MTSQKILMAVQKDSASVVLGRWWTVTGCHGCKTSPEQPQPASFLTILNLLLCLFDPQSGRSELSSRMAMASQAIEAIKALELPSSSNQEKATQFFQSVKQELKGCANYALVHVYSKFVSYRNAADRKRWLSNMKGDPSYKLETCEEAVRKPRLGSSINYWLCYSYSSPVFEKSSIYKDMVEVRYSEGEVADAKAIYNAGGGIWHAVLVKYHAQKVYVYDPQYPAPPASHDKSRLKDFRLVATAKHLITALKKRNKVQQVVITGGEGSGTMLCEHYCCDFLRKDILSYLSMDQVGSSTESTHCKEYAWEEVYF